MDDGVRFGDTVFDRSFLRAWRKTGEELKFTRAERALLHLFTSSKGKLLTRNQLLDAISDASSEVSDRNIDYAINRLRAKLGDPARSPSMIATQYGEGYVWIASPARDTAPIEALLVIGPVFGLDRMSSVARACLLRLQHAIDAQTADDQAVVLDEKWSADRNAADKVRFSLDVGFYNDGAHLHFAAALRDTATRRILKTFRLRFDQNGMAAGDPDIEGAVTSIKDAMWQHATTGQGALAGPKDTPLELRMHDAARLFLTTDASWAEMGEALAQARRDNPDDPETGLMWAMHLYARILQNPADIDNRAAFESEIETIVFDHLAAFQDNPVFLLGAAKLLLFVGRGHLGLAEQLADRAFQSSAAFASAFSVLGQIRMYRGEIPAAVALYDRGLELTEPDSEFRVYLMVLKCEALLAADDRAALDEAASAIYALKPATRLLLGLPLAPIGPLAPDLEAMLAKFDAGRARYAIIHVYYACARLFACEPHRGNIMRGLIGHLTRRFGMDIVPDEIRRSVPGLVSPRMEG